MVSAQEAVLVKIVEIFRRLGIDYFVGGSVASSIYGEPRFTQDIDLVVDLKTEHVPLLVQATESEFYVDAETIQDAIAMRSSCNLLELQTMVKVDVFLRQFSAWTDQVWERRREEYFASEETAIGIWIASPEDMILQKLTWYRMGGSVSDRQWRDVTSMVEVQASRLEYDYLQKWAVVLQVTDLLQKALQDAGAN